MAKFSKTLLSTLQECIAKAPELKVKSLHLGLQLQVKYLATGVALVFKTLSFIFMALSWYLYKRHQDKVNSQIHEEGV